MTFQEAKERQIECFEDGVYLKIVQPAPGFFILVDAHSREAAEKDMIRDAVEVIKRMPTRLRLLPGGKNDEHD